MERLTTNKDVQEMGMYELAHNCSYYKDGNARYRDFDMDMDARDFARNLIITLANDELPNDDDEFDEEILENLQYDQFSDVKGLIALFYRNLWAMADLRETLKAYEDAEEHGLLLKPKVALNSFVYWDSGYWGIIPYKVCNISYSIHGFCYEICAFNGDELLDDQEVVDDDFGKYVFFTYEEAEKEIKNKLQSHAESIMDERNGR